MGRHGLVGVLEGVAIGLSHFVCNPEVDVSILGRRWLIASTDSTEGRVVQLEALRYIIPLD